MQKTQKGEQPNIRKSAAQDAQLVPTRKAPASPLTDEEPERLRKIPLYAFLESLPPGVGDKIAATVKKSRSERLRRRV